MPVTWHAEYLQDDILFTIVNDSEPYGRLMNDDWGHSPGYLRTWNCEHYALAFWRIALNRSNSKTSKTKLTIMIADEDPYIYRIVTSSEW